MVHYNKKHRSKQQQNHHQKLEKAQSQWRQEAELLEQEKATIGCPDMPWDELFALDPNSVSDNEKQSTLIDLQTRYQELKEQEELLWAEDRAIAELNQKHAMVHVGQTYILTEKKDNLGHNDFSLEGRQSFKAYYEDEPIQCFDGKWRTKADVWLKNPKKHKYEGITFDPTRVGHSNTHYNLWRGFAVSPMQRSCSHQGACSDTCSLFWQHVKENICNNNDTTYQYLRKWLAYVFQHPDIPHTAIVLCGSQGTGKNTFVDTIGALLGRHYTLLSNIHELTSNFNSHLKHAVLIHANEALWGENKRDIGIIKTMITEGKCLIESKGKDIIKAPNFRHLIFSSNEDLPVHIDPDSRRFCVLTVSDKHKEDHNYFKQIQQELDDGGYEAILHDLLHEDISCFDPKIFPASSQSFEIKLRSAASPLRYLYEALLYGSFCLSYSEEYEDAPWQDIVSKRLVYTDYSNWCRDNKETPVTNAQFVKYIKKIVTSVEDVRPSGNQRNRSFKFRSLQQTREDFARSFKETVNSIFADNIE